MAFAHRMGRKKTIILGAFVSAIGSALQASAAAMSMLIFGRFVGGVAVGILTSTIPMYAAELAPAKYRGLQSGFLQWFLSWGFLVAQWLGFGLEKTDTAMQWRFPLAFQCVPALILLGGIYWLNESPRWLVEKGRHDEAKVVLRDLRGSGTPELDELVDLEFLEIHDVVEADRIANLTSWKTIFTNPSWRKRLLLGCGLQAFGPLSAINIINYYGPRIYAILDISTSTSLMIIGISGALPIVYCTIGLLLVDRIGRVKPLIMSAAGMAGALW